MNLPNIITLARIFLIPVFVVLYLVPGQWTYILTAAMFGLAAFTDWLDGYLARKLNQTTPFGAFLDPVADKLIVVSALVLLMAHHAGPGDCRAGDCHQRAQGVDGRDEQLRPGYRGHAG